MSSKTRSIAELVVFQNFIEPLEWLEEEEGKREREDI